MIGAVDIGGTKIAVGMAAENGRLLAHTQFPTDAKQGFAAAVKRITAVLRQTEAETGDKMRGIGVGCTGPVDPIAGKIGNVAFLPGWEGGSIAQALADRFGVPVVLENDADAAALAESAWGAGKGISRFIYVTVSTGIGGGMVVDGRLYRGAAGAHPEIGHHVIDLHGPACYCGARGCWESLAGGAAMAHWFSENAPDGLAVPEDISAREICAREDAFSRTAIAREGYYLGIGLANLITLFMPDVIALGGGMMGSYPLFAAKIQETIHSSCGLVPYEKTSVVTAVLGANSGILGAAAAWLHKFGAYQP